MNQNFLKLRAILFLVFMLSTAGSWAVDADDQDSNEGNKQDSTSEPKEAPSAAGAHFNPPDDDKPNSTPPYPTHNSGASAAGGADLAQAATDPSAVMTQFQNFLWTTGSSDDKNISNTYLFQPVLPMTKNNVLRPALPVVNTSGKTGIGDLFLLDVFLYPVKSGTWGWGVAGSVPIGADEFSSNKWQVGPAFLYINKTKPKFLWGVLLYNQWSFAGKSSASDVNQLTFQPIATMHTKWGYWGWTQQSSTIDWENNQSNISLGLRFGKVYTGKTPLNAALGFYYTLKNKGRENEFGIRITAAFIKPTWLRK